LSFGTQDIFVNVAGGVRLSEPAADLGIMAALTSSLLDRPVAGDLLIFGEVGLTGEVRTVSHTEVRLKEGAKLGFRRALVARGGKGPKQSASGLQVEEVASVREALAKLFGQETKRPKNKPS
jgi:DNA repair protein RadA/Sms